MNGDRRSTGTNFIIIGAALFIIGMFDSYISNWLRNYNSNIQIYGWGWLLQIVGGIFAIYGLMIHLEVYSMLNRPPSQPGMTYPPHYSLIDEETKRLIWVVLIVALIFFIVGPGFSCLTLIVIVIFLLFIFGSRPGWRYQFPFPPLYYPPPQPPPSQQAPATPSPSSNVKLCEKCYSQLELEWIACPFCGHSLGDKDNTKELKDH